MMLLDHQTEQSNAAGVSAADKQQEGEEVGNT